MSGFTVPTKAVLNERRRLIRDAIWDHGVEHFDLTSLYTGPHGTLNHEQARRARAAGEPWTACLAGHVYLTGATDKFALDWLGIDLQLPRLMRFSLVSWAMLPDPRPEEPSPSVEGWSFGSAYLERVADGQSRQEAEFWTTLEYLDRLIKRDEQ